MPDRVTFNGLRIASALRFCRLSMPFPASHRLNRPFTGKQKLKAEKSVHVLFRNLERAVQLAAKTNVIEGGLHEWFRKDHHLTFQVRWDMLREIRHKSNVDFPDCYQRERAEIIQGLNDLWEVYARAKPRLCKVEYRGRRIDAIDATLELINDTIKWHHDDGGYWYYFPTATNAEEANTIWTQLKNSNARYPMGKVHGLELIEALRESCGIMLLTLDAMPGFEVRNAEASENVSSCVNCGNEHDSAKPPPGNALSEKPIESDVDSLALKAVVEAGFASVLSAATKSKGRRHVIVANDIIARIESDNRLANNSQDDWVLLLGGSKGTINAAMKIVVESDIYKACVKQPTVSVRRTRKTVR
jgi:hypothetical protein